MPLNTPTRARLKRCLNPLHYPWIAWSCRGDYSSPIATTVDPRDILATADRPDDPAADPVIIAMLNAPRLGIGPTPEDAKADFYACVWCGGPPSNCGICRPDLHPET